MVGNSNSTDVSSSLNSAVIVASAAASQSHSIIQDPSSMSYVGRASENAEYNLAKVIWDNKQDMATLVQNNEKYPAARRKTLRYVLERQGDGPSFEAQMYINRIPDYLPSKSDFAQKLESCKDGTLLLNLAATFCQPLHEVETVKALFRFRDYFFNHEGSYNFTFNQFVRIHPLISCMMVKSKGQREKVKCPKAFVSESRCRMDTSHRARSYKTRSKKPKLECDCNVTYRIEIDIEEKLVTILVKGLHTHPIENVLAFKVSAFLVNIVDELCMKGIKNVTQLQSIMKKRLEPYDWNSIGFSQMLATRSHFSNRIAKFHPPNGLAKGFEPGTIVITHFESKKDSDGAQDEQDLLEMDLPSSSHTSASDSITYNNVDAYFSEQISPEMESELAHLQKSITSNLHRIQQASNKHHRNGNLEWVRRVSHQLSDMVRHLEEANDAL
ncbi:HGL171Cp [Eremothecium sinecaudum]|uniref:HGL171Cp n=1 Tax=Eremothecium sinecaudum TaxID=45286 RepID=A0A0X8HVA5_9SACH|nr:HGL171Cp [Eremothecium sinecaudum]AMD22169.1 HGL171Cp [Eremothecium sinecaudum]